jgi:hypothetical protein
MDMILDFPANLRNPTWDIGDTVKGMGRIIRSQTILRHPEDYTDLPGRLRKAADDLEGLLPKIQAFHESRGE